MVDREELAEQLLAQVREGELTVVDRLLQCYQDELREAARQHSATDPQTIDEALRRTYSRALTGLQHFDGNTSQLAEWLDEQLQETLDELSGATIQLPSGQTVVENADSGTVGHGEAGENRGNGPEPAGSDDTAGKAGAEAEVTLHKPIDSTRPHFCDVDDAPPDATLARPSGKQGSRSAATEGKLFGDYELLATIARGGMGVVYKARQRKLNRVVALKMILSGQFADQLDVDRFYAEAEAAANLRHPNIVTVYEVGECEGQHYFSMDYIDGHSLAELVRENPLPPQVAAEHARTIADAMQYAHEKGILHRDLKPANILVDRAQEPLITDFGLAKRVEGQSALTMSGTILGTPSYMPPEQAAGDGENVTACSDVYSLGAILYELITGSPPFRAANPFETIKQVLEKEPAAPRLLNTSIPVDLETICLKCLQKERSARYQSAQELSEELTRFLNGEPILARPVPLYERFIRVCKRNPGIASLSLLAVLFLFGFIGSFVWGYVTSQAALAEAENRLKLARHSVDKLSVQISQNELLNKPGFQSLRKDLLLQSRDLYQEILEAQPDDPRSRDDLARSYFLLGSILDKVDSPAEAIASYRRALEMQQELLAEAPQDEQLLFDISNTWNNIGTAAQRLERTQEALEALEQAVVYRARLVKQKPSHEEYVRRLANTHMNLGIFEKERGNYDQAEKQFRTAQALRDDHLNEEAGAALFRDQVENFFNSANLALEARDHAASQGPEQQRKARVRLQQTLEDYERAIADLRKVAADQTENLEYQHFLGVCHFLNGDLRVAIGDVEGALAQYQQARKVLRQLCRENPDVVEYQESLAKLLINLAGLQLMATSDMPPEHSSMQRLLGRVHRFVQQANEWLAQLQTADLAEQTYQDAKELLEDLLKRHPDYADYRAHYAALLRGMANQQWNDGDLEAARKTYQTACQQLDELIAQYPDHPKYVLDCAQAQGSAARLAIDLSMQVSTDAEALQLLNEAEHNLEGLTRQYPQDRFYGGYLASALYERAMVLWRTGDRSAAEGDMLRAVTMFRKLAEQHDEQEYVLNRDRALGNLAALQLELATELASDKNIEKAAVRVADAVDDLRRLVAAYPGVAIFADDYQVALDLLARLHSQLAPGALADRIAQQLGDSRTPERNKIEAE